MLALLSHSLTALVESTVSGGYVVALALICLLQYAVYVYSRFRAKRQATQLRRDIDQLESDYALARKDRGLARLEALALRRFVTQPDWGKSVASLLRQFVSGSPGGFAAFFRNNEGEAVLAEQHGLSPESCARLSLGAKILLRLRTETLFVISGETWQKSEIRNALYAADRCKVTALSFVAVGEATDPVGWLLTTSLLPSVATFAEQQQFTSRLLNCIAPVLRDKMQLAEQDDHLRSSSEMLTMRSLLDQQWESPAQMLEELLSHATAMMDADRAALYLCAPDSPQNLRLLIRTGTTLPAGIRENWQRSEDSLAQVALDSEGAACFDAEQLVRLGIRSLIGAAMLIPVVRSSKIIGLVCLTRRGTESFSERHLRQAEWVGQLLAETMPRLGSQAAAERQARLDGLTGLANRAAFDRQFARDVDLAERTGGVCSLLLLDLDRFKSINDRYGHQAGDEVLRRTAAVVQECAESIRAKVRMADSKAMAARYGGEELALLLPGVDERTARRIAEDCRTRIELLMPCVNGLEIPVTTSIGMATFPVHGYSCDELFGAADAALYEAKSSGRNRVCAPTDVLAETGV